MTASPPISEAFSTFRQVPFAPLGERAPLGRLLNKHKAAQMIALWMKFYESRNSIEQNIIIIMIRLLISIYYD